MQREILQCKRNHNKVGCIISFETLVSYHIIKLRLNSREPRLVTNQRTNQQTNHHATNQLIV